MAVVFPAPTYPNVDQRPVGDVLARMAECLSMRKAGRTKRSQFLAAWSRLRRELERTREYQAFRRAVLERDKYTCVSCHRVAHTVHHRRRVARALHLALKTSNGEVICDECHAGKHACLRRAS